MGRHGLRVDSPVLRVGAPGDGHPGVARNADHRHIAAVGRDMHQHLHIGQRRFRVSLGAAELDVLRGVPAVRADQQDVEGGLSGGVGLGSAELAVAEVSSAFLRLPFRCS